jgi:Zn-dependent protease
VSGAPGPASRHPRRSFGLPLGRIGGIAIIVAPSWLVSAVIIVVLATPVIRQLVRGISSPGAIAVAVLLAILLGVSVLAHELGHCLAARSLGVPVREVRLYLVGGVSELGRSPASPKEEALIAGAGPGVSALLAVICGLLVGSTDPGTVAWLLLLEMAVANAIVAIFNILPALPLDGGRVLRAGVWGLFRRRRVGTIAAVIGGFVVAAALLVWGIVEALHGTRVSLLYAAIAAVMGIFVAAGAMAEWPVRRARRWPEEVTVASLARPVLQLPGETPVGMALGVAGHRAVVLTGADGIAVGVLDPAGAAQLAAQYPSSPSSLAARPVQPGMIVLADDSPEEVVERLSQEPSPFFLLVGAEGHPVGVLLRSDVERVLNAPAVAAGGR